MSGRDIINIFPSRANLVLMKQRISAATTGLSLLKRKRDALELHVRHITSELKIIKTKMEEAMREAVFSMAKATFLRTDFKPASIDLPKTADAFLNLKQNKIVGMNVPTLELVLHRVTSLPLTGLSCGGQQVEIVRMKFQEALKVLIAIASLEHSLRVVQEAVKLNNRRVNGLDFVVLPRYQRTLCYIRDELDEFEREDFYRLKRSQAKQKKKKAEFLQLVKDRAPHESEIPHLEYDVSEWTNRPTGLGQMGMKGSASGVRRRTISQWHGTKVALVPEDEIKPVIIGGEGRPRPPKKELDENAHTKDVVTTSSSSSVSSDEYGDYY